MKKLLAIILSVCLAASIAGCSKKDDDVTSGSGKVSSAEGVSSGEANSDGEDSENESYEPEETDFSYKDEAETEEITVYTNSSKDYYWTPFDSDEAIVDYSSDHSDSVQYSQLDSVMQVVPKEAGESVIVVVKNGGEKKKLKITVVEGDDPENPPEKQDDNVYTGSYDPSKLIIPSTYYYKIEEKYPNDINYSYICAHTKTEYSSWTQDGDDKTTEYARYLNTETRKVYDWDYESGWVDQNYSDIDYSAELANFEDGTYFMGNTFVDHFYGFDDVMKYKIGEEKIQNIDCYVFEQKISDDHYYRYYVQPSTNVTLKMVECVPVYGGIHSIEMTSYVEYLPELPTNLNLKPSSL